MAENTSFPTAEGQSIHRPPLFDGTSYTYWRDKMKLFIEFNSMDLWDRVENGDYIPVEESVTEGGERVSKLLPKDKWTPDQKAKIQLNSKAKYLLICALTKTEYDKIIACDSAKEIWDRLEMLHEGTDQVKETKIDMLVHKYEQFKMETNEPIDQMMTRFLHIVNQLKNLGHTYANADLVRKILRSLPSKWLPKVTAITEAKDLKTLSLDALVGSLKVHEIELDNLSEPSKGKDLALKVSHKKKKKQVKALVADSEAESEDESEEDEDQQDEDNEDIALLIRKMTRTWMRRKKGKGVFRKDPQNKGATHITCFNCKEKGHYASECPKLKENQAKGKGKMKKAYAATLSDDEKDEDSTEEVANLCFMADYDSEGESEVTFSELKFMYELLLSNSEKLAEQHLQLKKEFQEKSCELSKAQKVNAETQKTIENLKTENQKLLKDNGLLRTSQINTQKEVSELISVNKLMKSDLEKMAGSSQALDLMLGGQKPYLSKHGLGYIEEEETNCCKAKCIYCFKSNHRSEKCFFRKKFKDQKKNRSQKPVTALTNKKGPKKIWVPKKQNESDAGLLQNHFTKGEEVVHG